MNETTGTSTGTTTGTSTGTILGTNAGSVLGNGPVTGSTNWLGVIGITVLIILAIIGISSLGK